MQAPKGAGAVIRAARIQAGWSMRELAVYMGISDLEMADIERGVQTCAVFFLGRVCDAIEKGKPEGLVRGMDEL